MELARQIRRLNRESELLAQDVVRDLEGLLERIETLEDALTERVGEIVILMEKVSTLTAALQRISDLDGDSETRDIADRALEEA